jgi:hypothetical protein
VPLSGESGLERGERGFARDHAAGAHRATAPGGPGIHGSLPHVRRMLAALPPYAPGPVRQDLARRERAVFRRVPLARKCGVEGAKGRRGRGDVAAAHRTAAASAGAHAHRRAPDVRGVAAAAPPDAAVAVRGHVRRRDRAVLRRMPLSRDVRGTIGEGSTGGRSPRCGWRLATHSSRSFSCRER